MTWSYGRQAPNTNLMTFMEMKFPGRRGHLRILDIGSGEGANARELAERRFVVAKLDIDPATDPDICADIRTVGDPPWPLDCVYDINTLCHVEDQDGEVLKKIKSWIIPGGYFYSIAPTDEAPQRVCEGKNYTILRTEYQMRQWLETGFKREKIIIWGPTNDPDYRGNYLKSWIAEARK